MRASEFLFMHYMALMMEIIVFVGGTWFLMEVLNDERE